MKLIQMIALWAGLLSLPVAGHAFYNPETGRWLNRDPLQEKGGLSLYAFVLNNPLSQYDWLGLCGCICTSVDIVFEPGGNSFQWGITKEPNTGKPPVKLGNNIKVKWTVQGDCKFCEFRQDETDISITAGYNDDGSDEFSSEPPREGRDNKIPSEWITSDCSYYDRLGVHLSEVGYYFAKVKGKIVFKCSGTDKKSVTKTLSLEASAIAGVPRAPKDPFVKAQKVNASKLD